MKINIISVGDIHGRNYWKSIDPTKYDKIIFNGDYVDQFPLMTDVEIETNLLEIIELKKQYPEKVVLLIGNHDAQYMFLNEGFETSGFRPTMGMKLKMIFSHNKRLFQIAHQIDNYIWSHAGITQGWYDYNKVEIEEVWQKFECIDVADTLNHMLFTNHFRLLFQVGKDRGGYYPHGGLVWVDRSKSKNDYLLGYHQIVGHTPINQITKFGDENGSIRYIDVLNEVYFWIEDNKKLNKDIPYPGEMFYEFELTKKEDK